MPAGKAIIEFRATVVIAFRDTALCSGMQCSVKRCSMVFRVAALWCSGMQRGVKGCSMVFRNAVLWCSGMEHAVQGCSSVVLRDAALWC